MYYDIKFYPKDNNMIMFTIHMNVWNANSDHVKISFIALYNNNSFLSCTFKVGIVIIMNNNFVHYVIGISLFLTSMCINRKLRPLLRKVLLVSHKN